MKKFLQTLMLVIICFTTLVPLVDAEEANSRGVVFNWITGTMTHPNTLPTSGLLDGDLLFSWNPGCAYGEWTHVMMVATDNNVKKIIHATSGYSQAIQFAPLTYVNSTANVAASVRVNVSQSLRSLAATKAVEFKNTANGCYDWNSSVYSPINSNTTWQCAKLIERAYYDSAAGINLWYKHTWFPIYPGSIFGSPYLSVIQRSSYENVTPLPWTPPSDMNRAPRDTTK